MLLGLVGVKRRWWRSYNTKWVQFVKDQCKVSYAEAVQRVAR